MKPNVKDITRTSTFEGEKIAMRLDQQSLVHLQSILTDIYSDPIMACIREYLQNALDSHQEAGQTKPIEVITPTAFSPSFIVKDFGIGLSADDLRNIYSAYGASTKRNTNDQSGMLGIGCKAALTYTDQFTLRAVKAGKKTVAIVSRDETGAGMIEIISHSDTDEDNGVSITIPSNDHQEFQNKTKDFLRFWNSNSVILNGEQLPEQNFTQIADNIRLYESNDSHYNTRDIIVMGGVSYPLEDRYAILCHGYYNCNNYVVIEVPIGAIDFTPSREALHYTDRTISTIKEYALKVRPAIQAALQKEIDKHSTHLEAIRYAQKNTNIEFNSKYNISNIRTHMYNYRGESLSISSLHYHYSYNLHWDQFSKANGTTVQPGQEDPAVIVYNFNIQSLSINGKKRLRQYIEENDIDTNRVGFSRNAPDEDKDGVLKWFNIEAIDWNKVKEIKLPTVAKAKRTEKYSYATRRGGTDREYTSDIGEEELWMTYEDFNIHGNFCSYLDVDRIIITTKNNEKAFLRDYPDAIAVKDRVQEKVDEFYANLTEEDIREISIHLTNEFMWNKTRIDKAQATTTYDFIKKQTDEILDINIKTMLRNSGIWDKYDRIHNIQVRAKAIAPFDIRPVEIEKIINKKYPLIKGIRYVDQNNVSDFVKYVNVKHKQLGDI